MTTNFTNELLVKYIYGEVSPAEKRLIEEQLDADWEVHELYTELMQSYQELPKVQFAPNKSVIQNILKYSNEQTALKPQF
jgi:uncharacterized protein YbcI